MYNTKLLAFLSPYVSEIKEQLSPKSMPIFPFYQTVSRLKYNPDAFDVKNTSGLLSDIIQLPNHNKTFSDVADERAAELKNLDGEIFVLWSGGIDSTTVLVSIFKTWDQVDLQRLVILCDSNSIDENKNFFKLIIKLGIKIQLSSNNIEQHLHHGHVITGEMGDQIFGSDIVLNCINRLGENSIHQSWKVTGPAIFNIFKNGSQDAFDHYVPIIDEAPFEIITTQDFFWWLNISQKWQHVKYRTLMSESWRTPKLTFPKLLHFFDSVPFQIWSIHNHHDKKIKKSVESYKFTAKEYIHEYTNDDTMLNQPKLSSLENLYKFRNINWAIDEDWNFLTKDEALKRVKL